MLMRKKTHNISGWATVCVELALSPVSGVGFLKGLRFPSSSQRCACEGHQGDGVAPVRVCVGEGVRARQRQDRQSRVRPASFPKLSGRALATHDPGLK